MKTNKILAIILGTVWSVWFAGAQQSRDSLQSQTVTVTKSYTPTVRDADKISVNPPEVSREIFQKIPQTYAPLEIKAVSTYEAEKGKPARPRVPQARPRAVPGYVELAAGNAKAFRLRSYYTYVFPSQWKAEAGLRFFNLGTVRYDSLTAAHLNDLEVYTLTSHTNARRAWKFKAAYAGHRSAYRDTLAPLSELAVAFANHHAGLEASLEGYRAMRRTALSYGYLSAYAGHEHHADFRSRWKFPVRGFDIRTTVLARGVHGTGGGGYSHFTGGVRSGFHIEKTRFLFKVGIKMYYQTDREDYAPFQFFPDLTVEYNMVPELLTLYLQYEGDLRMPAYDEMLRKNRYLAVDTALRPALIPYIFKGGFKGNIGSRTVYNLILGMGREENALLWRSDKRPYGLVLVPVFDRLDYFYFKVHLSYVVNDVFETKIKFDYYQYNPETQAKAWNREDYKLSWLAYVHAGKFSIRSDVYYIGPRYDLFEGKTVKTGDLADVNLKVSYRVQKGLYVYAEGRNLLNRKDLWYYAYPLHGLHVLGGVTYSFD